MIRIIGVQRSERPEKEFVLLQNQGARRIPLEGFLLTDDLGLGDPMKYGDRIYYFRTDIKMIPSAYVALVTGWGEDGWRKTDDCTAIYQMHWGREHPVWSGYDLPLHLLSVVNTHACQPEGYLVRR